MQPPTEPRSPARLCGDEDDLYRRHHRELRRAVASAVHAPPELIEDACQSAWAKLLRNQPRRGTFFAWLRVVAIHEACRLSTIEGRDLHLEDLPRHGRCAVTAGGATLDEMIEAREALRLLAQLPQRQRDDLALLVGGFSYREIAEMTGRRTYTNVSKHLTKARVTLRKLETRAAAGRRRGQMESRVLLIDEIARDDRPA